MHVIDRWRQKVMTAFDRFLEGSRRIEVLIALFAVLTACAAYRANDRESNSIICDHQSHVAETYELVQRQRHLDAAIEHERWSGRYNIATYRAAELGRAARDFSKKNGVGRDNAIAGLFDDEAQIEHGVARMIAPIQDFVNPRLGTIGALEARLRARSEQDVQDLGIPRNCPLSDTQSAVLRGDRYLDPFRRDVDDLHRNALDDARLVTFFVVVLAFLTLAEASQGVLRRASEIGVIAGIGASFIQAVRSSDKGLQSFLGEVAISLLILTCIACLVEQMRAAFADLDDAANASVPTSISADFHGLTDHEDADAVRKSVSRLSLIAISAFIVFQLAVVATVWYGAKTRQADTMPILVIALLLLVAIGLTSFKAISDIRTMSAVLWDSPERVEEVKRAFINAAATLIVIGVFAIITPWVARSVQHHRMEWMIGETVLGGIIVVFVFIFSSSRRLVAPPHPAARDLSSVRLTRSNPAKSTNASAADSEALAKDHSFKTFVAVMIEVVAVASAILTLFYLNEAGRSESLRNTGRKRPI